MQRSFSWVCGIVLVCAMPAWGGLIINPGFEQPVVTDQYHFQYYYAGDTSITGWTIVGNSVDVLNSARWAPHEGTQSVDLTGVTTGGIYQDISTVAGKTYHLSFWLAGNPEFAGNGGGGPFVKQMKLSWGGGAVATLSADVTGKTNFNLGWKQYEYDLTATGATTRLEFDSLTGGFSGPMLDDLSLVELLPPAPPGVPVPAAAFLGMFGAGLVGVVRRRRK